MAKVITALAAVTVVAGWILSLRDMSLYDSLGDWLGTRVGIVLTIGGVLATIAFFLGAFGGANVERLVDLGNEVARSRGPPHPRAAGPDGAPGARARAARKD